MTSKPHIPLSRDQALVLVAELERRLATRHPLPDVNPTDAFCPTPIVHWWLQYHADLRAFHQSMWMPAPPGLSRQHLVGAVQQLIDRHDALRLRIVGPRSMPPRLAVATPGSIDADPCVQHVAAEPGAAESKNLARAARQALERLDPHAGVLMQVVFADPGVPRPGRVLLLVHHLAVDGVSWRVLLPDLLTACQSLMRGTPSVLPPATMSYRDWARHLELEAERPERCAERPYWEMALRSARMFLPGARIDGVAHTVERASGCIRTLTSDVTRAVLGPVPAAFHGSVNDVLLSAFALAAITVRERHGDGAAKDVTIAVESHGRHGEHADLDVSRTVGWFTSAHPVCLSLESIDIEDSWAGGDALGALVKSVKEQLRTLPDNGLGFGLLRYLNAATAGALAALGEPQIGFNYLGRFAGQAGDWAPRVDAGDDELGRRAGTAMTHPIEVNAVSLSHADGVRLVAYWSWVPELVSEPFATAFADGWFRALEQLSRYVDRTGAGGRTPSDLPLVSLTQPEIEHLERASAGGALDDVWPLMPAQETLLYQMLDSPPSPGERVQQFVHTVDGELDHEALRAAWHAVLMRHGNLRTAFHHRHLRVPVQTVLHTVTAPWSFVDLSTCPRDDRERRFTRLLDDEWHWAFDWTQPPLIRLALARIGPGQHRLVLTVHHLVLDGWSIPLLLGELWTLCDYPDGAARLPRPVPLPDYLEWLSRQDADAAKAAWGHEMAACRVPLWPPAGAVPRRPARAHTIHTELSASTTRALRQAAKTAGVTFGTLVQTAWALLLRRWSGRDEVVFGITVSVRPPELPAIARAIGLFVNTVPVRLVIGDDEAVAHLLRRVQQRYGDLLPHYHCSLHDIEDAAGRRPLFDTLVVVQNQLRPTPLSADAGVAPRVSAVTSRHICDYPLSVQVMPAARALVRLEAHPDTFTEVEARRMTADVVGTLRAIARDPGLDAGTWQRRVGCRAAVTSAYDIDRPDVQDDFSRPNERNGP